jgi:hypothetical protein
MELGENNSNQRVAPNLKKSNTRLMVEPCSATRSPSTKSTALEDGLTPPEWYRLLNRKVFFWGPESRLGILRSAREYEADRQTIVVVDATQLVDRHGDRILLCHMNSGATQPMAWPRGTKTFLPIDEYPLAERRKKYGVKGAVAEVTVDYAVPDLREFVVEAYEAGGGRQKLKLV